MVPLAALLVEGIQVSFSLFPTAALIQLGGYREDMAYAEDYDLDLRIHRAGYRFILFDTPSAKIRQHHGHRLTRPASGRVFRILPVSHICILCCDRWCCSRWVRVACRWCFYWRQRHSSPFSARPDANRDRPSAMGDRRESDAGGTDADRIYRHI
jgi:hypothetical protein